MNHHLPLTIQPQPSSTTCGPTCLHAVYRYHGDSIGLDDVIEETATLEEGGTLAVMLGCHALQRGYRATICTFNVRVFDPTWFAEDGRVARGVDLTSKLRQQTEVKPQAKLTTACEAYTEFLARGGEIRMEDLKASLLRRYLKQELPLLTGLSATWLYHEAREIPATCHPDDVAGIPTGHFVVLCGYTRGSRQVRVADPWSPNPISGHHRSYDVGVDRVICSILLGILTYDANLLVIRPSASGPLGP